MSTTLQRKKLIVKASAIHGFGVFAGEDIKAEEIIEECCLITYSLNVPELQNYHFHLDDNYFTLALGYGSLYNHSKLPNASYETGKHQPVLVFKASRFIKNGEEIFISYGEKWFSHRGLVIKTDCHQNQLGESLARFICVSAALFFITFIAKWFLLSA